VLLADLRHETASRLEAAGIELDWPVSEGLGGVEIDPRIGKSLASAHRELVSNVIRHSGATRMQARVKLEDGWLEMNVRDDGTNPCGGREGTGDGCTQGGHGLRNMKRRIDELGGQLAIELGRPGCPVSIRLPLSSARQRRAA
jgi:signal transduction histidine kinase